MKKHTIALISRSLLALLFAYGIAAAEETPQLEKLKYTAVSSGAEEVTLQLNGSYSPKIFTLKGESPRVILDFADMTHSREIKSITTTNGSIIKRVRVGMHADDSPKTRVVFDLATLKNVDYTQSFDEKTSTLTLRFTGPGKTAETKKTVAQRKQQDKAAEQAVTAETQAEAVQETPATSAPTVPEAPAATQPETTTTEPAAKTSAQEEAVAAASEKPAQQQPAAPAQPTTPAIEPPAPTPPAPAPQAEQAKPQTTAAEKKAEVPPQPAVPAPKETATVAAKPEAPSTPPPVVDAAKEGKTAPTAPAVADAKQEEKKADKTAKTPPPAEASKADAKAEKAKSETPAKGEEGPQLEYVKFDPNSPKGEMVLFKLNGFHPPAVHGVEEGIPRVVCDFNNTKLLDSGKNTIKANGKFVKMIRTSKTKKPEKVRVVIDLEPNRSYDLQQVFFKDDNLFVIIVNTVKK
ncbi:AMIN domain-containing protein [Desulfobulbus sp.]|uniref:AMIN domain-containing protein n=1 Tax=Desulfobulbus sp. TaxID=895 RepID=UPI0027B97278|nr:AMIN domain-containing protein [Desulfobulbus sp.]